MEYEKGYVYKLMDEGGPTDNREPYFKEAVDEMMRSRVLCAKANAAMPDDPSWSFALFNKKELISYRRLLTAACPRFCEFFFIFCASAPGGIFFPVPFIWIPA